MMTSNPMQRKTRNAFLLGVIITLLIAGVIIAFLFLMLKQKNEEINAEKAAKRMVYALAEDVKSGQILTKDMFVMKNIHKDAIPSNATAAAEVIETWFLQTKAGEPVYTDKQGLYFDRSAGDRAADTIIEVMKNTGASFKDTKGKEVSTGDFYVSANGVTEKVSSTDNVQEDEFGMFFIDTQQKDVITRVYQETLTEEFYVFKLETDSTNNTKKRVKEYVDIKNVPVIAKVNMNANTVITSQLIVQSDEIITDDTRIEEYNMLTLPFDLMTNDYVDIRLKTPDGQNIIVLSKKQVEVPENADGTYLSDTIRLKLREDEILVMSSAIVEAYGLNGAELYATKYVDPAMQDAATPTYTPNVAVTVQIQSNPNIVEMAKIELASRYSEAAKNVRNQYLQQAINAIDKTQYDSSIQQSVQEGIGKSLTKRQQYLESLGY